MTEIRILKKTRRISELEIVSFIFYKACRMTKENALILYLVCYEKKI